MEQDPVFQTDTVLNPTVNPLYSSFSIFMCMKCSQWSILQMVMKPATDLIITVGLIVVKLCHCLGHGASAEGYSNGGQTKGKKPGKECANNSCESKV